MSEHEYGDPVAPEDLPPAEARGSASEVSAMPQHLRHAAGELSTMSENLSYQLCEGNMASRDFVDSWHGADPSTGNFKGQRMETGGLGHTEYWNEGTVSLENQAFVITGQYDSVGKADERWW